MATLGTLLKRQRERHGWTQQEVVERAGLDRSSSYISSIETGKTSPSIDELDALARLFGTTSIDLLREASGIPDDWEFEPNSDLARLVTTYQALDPVEKDSALAYLEFLLERQQRKVLP
jgi:transcriptional regulator with XRE-family HTH domain